MITVPAPEMLWESRDADAELARRFDFDSTDAAVAWVAALLTDDYGLTLITVDRVVISGHNLMIWAGIADGRRVMIKICRLAIAHDWLDSRAAMVRWLGERDHPVASPVLSLAGDHQLLRDGRSIGIQPVLTGALLDAGDHDQVRAAGATLAALHLDLVEWPDAARLDHAGPVAGDRGGPWGLPEERVASAPDLADRLQQRVADLPELPRQATHTDYRGANLLCRDGKISGILDFEEARLDHAVVDLANAVCLLGTWYHEWQPISADVQTLLIDSYTERRPLSDDEQAWLAPLVAWRMLGQGWLDDAHRWLDS